MNVSFQRVNRVVSWRATKHKTVVVSFIREKNLESFAWDLDQLEVSHKPHIPFWMYAAVIGPQGTYESLIWWKTVNHYHAHKSKMEGSTGAFRSIHFTTLE